MADHRPGRCGKIILLMPLVGICSFVLMYIVAASLYPGGSRVDKAANGFNLFYNYWCDLFDVVALNGAKNPARPVAITAMTVLAVSLSILWYLLPRLFDSKYKSHKVIQYAGTGSMVSILFLFTNYHEEAINVGGLLGGIALILIFIELYKSGKRDFFVFGVVNLILSCINYFIYKTGILFSILATTQKITFLTFFIWAGLLNLELFRKEVKNDLTS